MIEVKDLEANKLYWYCSLESNQVTPLLFMNKLHGRKAYRFVQEGSKKLFVLHEQRLYKLFLTYSEAARFMASLFKAKARQYELAATGRGHPPLLERVLMPKIVPRGTKIGRR